MSAFAKAITSNLRLRSSRSASAPPSDPACRPETDDAAANGSTATSASAPGLASRCGPGTAPAKAASPPRFRNRGGYTVADIKQRLFNQGLKIDVDGRRPARKTRYRDYLARRVAASEQRAAVCSPACVPCAATLSAASVPSAVASCTSCCCSATTSPPVLADCKAPPAANHVPVPCPPPPTSRQAALALWQRDTFLAEFVPYLRPRDLPAAAAVSRHWLAAVSASGQWARLAFVVDFQRTGASSNSLREQRAAFQRRGYHVLVLRHVGDLHVPALLEAFSAVEQQVLHLRVELSTVTDRGLERITDCFSSASALDLIGCNDISEVALWSCLSPRLHRLTIQDCVHVADDTLGAVSQLLPNLRELSLQAYHISDLSLSYFNSKQGATVERVRLTHCMEVTNRGLLNLVHALPNLRHLSLAGCSKINDDGVDLLCENLKLLKTLDLSWCNKITDGGLECIACDLQALEDLYLDRCTLVTDLGIGYLTNLPQLRQLSLRFCHGISDLSVSHLKKLPRLSWLSIAGCKQLSADGLLTDGTRFPALRRLEVTNCPGLTLECKAKLSQSLPTCVILD